MKKTISLGDIHMETYKKGGRLFPDYYYSKVGKLYGNYYKFKKEIEDNSPEEIILPSNKSYELIISYPLTIPFITNLNTGANGLTRKEVINFIVKCYKQIYKEEDKSTKIKTGYIPNMFNRNETNGKYKIWGHYLCDLMLNSLYVNANKLTVGVDS